MVHGGKGRRRPAAVEGSRRSGGSVHVRRRSRMVRRIRRRRFSLPCCLPRVSLSEYWPRKTCELPSSPPGTGGVARSAGVVAHRQSSSSDHPSCAVGAASPPVSGGESRSCAHVTNSLQEFDLSFMTGCTPSG